MNRRAVPRGGVGQQAGMKGKDHHDDCAPTQQAQSACRNFLPMRLHVMRPMMKRSRFAPFKVTVIRPA
jgi:hypothetical protein